jgi:hypothetical protein
VQKYQLLGTFRGLGHLFCPEAESVPGFAYAITEFARQILTHFFQNVLLCSRYLRQNGIIRRSFFAKAAPLVFLAAATGTRIISADFRVGISHIRDISLDWEKRQGPVMAGFPQPHGGLADG